MMFFFLWVLYFVSSSSLASPLDSDITITVDWSSNVSTPTNTTPTYQTSINPKYRMDNVPLGGGHSNISTVVFQNMAALNADYMRHVPWFPYPRLAVAELVDPSNNKTLQGSDTNCTTSWDFSLIDPITEALYEATIAKGKPVVMNFATPPQWMYQTGSPVSVPANPDERDPSYEQGTIPVNATLLVDYYVRIAQWYTMGSFIDECGVTHTSKRSYNMTFAWWEVFNEMEHQLSIELYDQLYDAIVTALQALPSMKNTKFLGLAMGSHNQFDYYKYHLTKSNHHPSTVPLDGISYHQYVLGSNTDLNTLAQTYFSSMDTFVSEVTQIEAIRKQLSPSTETFINEIGCGSKSYFEPGFFNLCAATYAYLFAKLAPLGIGHLGMSQVIGFTGSTLCPTCPDEWPSTSMVDWYTGNGNARYWVLKMMIEQFPTGLKYAQPTTITSSVSQDNPNIYAQGLIAGSKQKILLINKSQAITTVTISGAGAATQYYYVDDTTGSSFSCTGEDTCIGINDAGVAGTITLAAFSVAVVTI